MKKINSITFTIKKETQKTIDIILNTEEGKVAASLICEAGKNLGGSFKTECTEDRQLFYKKHLTLIFAELIKYKIPAGVTITGEFTRNSLDRVIDVSTQSGLCKLRGSSAYCYQSKQSTLTLKCVHSYSTLTNSDKIASLVPPAQFVAAVFDKIFYH